jgi:WD40 repeat protein
MRNLVCVLAVACVIACSVFDLSPATAQAGFHQIAKFGSSPLGHLAWSPDGRVLTVLNLYTVILYTSALKKITEFDNQGAARLAWSADGKYLAGAGQSLWIWNIATRNRQVLWPFNTDNGTILDVAWSPDGTRLLTEWGDIWDVKSSKVVANIAEKDLRSVTWSPDGLWIATSNDTVRIWDAKTYQFQNFLSADTQLHVDLLAWSTDSKFLAGAVVRQEIVVWDVVSRNVVTTLNAHSGNIQSLAWSQDGKFLASGDDHIHVWDTTTWQQKTLDAPKIAPKTLDEQTTGLVEHLAWNRDGTLASMAQNEVHIWDISTGQQLHMLSNDDYVAGGPISWSPDSKQLAIGVRNTIQMRSGSTGVLMKKIDTHRPIELLAWSPNSSLVATTDGQRAIQIWNASTEQLVQALDGPPVNTSDRWKKNLAWSPDGTRLAALSVSDGVTIWDTNEWKKLTTFPADCFSWSPDSKALAIGLGLTAYTIDSTTGSVLVKLASSKADDYPEYIDAIWWSPRGDRIADQQFYPNGAPRLGVDLIWDAKTGKILAREPLSDGFGWHPAGKLVARHVLLHDPRYDRPHFENLQIYNLDTKAALILRDMRFIAWSPDGKRFVSKGQDYTIRIWG